MRVRIYPYNMSSRSARLLKEAIPVALRVREDGRYRPRRNDLVVNWGNPRQPDWFFPMLNFPDAVSKASNKLHSFQLLKEAGVNGPEFTTDPHEAYEWDSGVVARSLLRANSGRGITYIPRSERDLLLGSLSSLPLYVKYEKKVHEYRVHVFKGRVIDVQQKRVREGSDGNNFQIRSHDNGWVFCRSNVDRDPELVDQAVKAVEALGLDFGAVDIVYNAHYNRYTVLEVNTAPGLEGYSVEIYANAIKEIANEL